MKKKGKTYFLPPLAPIAIQLFAVFVAIVTSGPDPSQGPGATDDQHHFAIAFWIYLLLSPIAYIILLVINYADSQFDKYPAPVNWFGTIGSTAVLAFIFTAMFHTPEVGDTLGHSILVATIYAAVTMFSMAAIRRFRKPGSSANLFFGRS